MKKRSKKRREQKREEREEKRKKTKKKSRIDMEKKLRVLNMFMIKEHATDESEVMDNREEACTLMLLLCCLFVVVCVVYCSFLGSLGVCVTTGSSS